MLDENFEVRLRSYCVNCVKSVRFVDWYTTKNKMMRDVD